MFPPYKCQLRIQDLVGPDALPAMETGRRLAPADPQPIDPIIRVNGSSVLTADTLQFDLVSESFDRSPAADDPPWQLVFEIANGFISRVRVLAKVPHAVPLNPRTTIAEIAFLTDDEQEFEPTPDGSLIRHRYIGFFQVHTFWLGPDLWNESAKLPLLYSPAPWDRLLLDATRLMPDVGPAIVLAFSALETRVESALDRIAQFMGIRPALWEWINDRENFWKEPSTGEQFDVLLHAVLGRSLKTDPRLWEGFANLRQARNTFAHDGVAVIGPNAVTEDKAQQLLGLAGEIIDWLEQFLPEGERRPRFNNMDTMVEVLAPLTAPEPMATPLSEEAAIADGQATSD